MIETTQPAVSTPLVPLAGDGLGFSDPRDISKALRAVTGQDWRSLNVYVGGHGDMMLVDRPGTLYSYPVVQVDGRWYLGKFGTEFGKPDYQKTSILVALARSRRCRS